MPTDFRFIRNVLLKALLLFITANIAFAWLNPLPLLGKVSAYNLIFPGRERLPYGENPERAYNLSLFQLDALFASHAVAQPKPANEYRVLLIGDSSVWGLLLKAEDTLAAQINAAHSTTPDGRAIRAYNLGYPIMSLTKDLLILNNVRRYQPDLIIWMVTLESFPYTKQLFPSLLQHNPEPVRELIRDYNLKLDLRDPSFVDPSFWDRTIIGQRRALADVLRLQLYGVMWAATGIDQDIPETYTPRAEDLPADQAFHNLPPPHLTEADLAFEVLAAGVKAAGDTPLLILNEPMFVSQGKNSDIRYNFFYPRWAYDDYHALLAEQAQKHGWQYYDLWEVVSQMEYTDSAVHLTPTGEAQLAAKVGEVIREWAK